MSNELNDVCEKCEFVGKFKEFVEEMEAAYISVMKENPKALNFVDFIMNNSNSEDCEPLSYKEKFLFGLGVASAMMVEDEDIIEFI